MLRCARSPVESRIAAGLQCGKRLWLAVHLPDSRCTELTPSAASASGTMSRPGAAPLRTGQTDPCDGALSEALRLTGEALARGRPTIFEGAFRHPASRPQRRAAASVRCLHMVEVKSATRLKEYHVQDVAIQAWTTEGQGSPGQARCRRRRHRLRLLRWRRLSRSPARDPVADQVRPMMARVPAGTRPQRGPRGAAAGHQDRATVPQAFDCPFTAFCRQQEGLPPLDAGARRLRSGPVGPAFRSG